MEMSVIILSLTVNASCLLITLIFCEYIAGLYIVGLLQFWEEFLLKFYYNLFKKKFCVATMAKSQRGFLIIETKLLCPVFVI